MYFYRVFKQIELTCVFKYMKLISCRIAYHGAWFFGLSPLFPLGHQDVKSQHIGVQGRGLI